MRCLIDANVILRYLLDDNEEMALVAEQVIAGDAWTTPEVLAEVEYVLRDVYEIDRADTSAAFDMLGGLIEMEPKDVIFTAFDEYAETNLDFVDCMLVAYDKLGKTNTFTFDKEIRKRIANT